ncbi:hypothetical protein AAMO2058_001290500 [Amorphochlora amoebiformis]
MFGIWTLVSRLSWSDSGCMVRYFQQKLFPEENFLFLHPGAAFVIGIEDDPEDLMDILKARGVSTDKKLIFFPVNNATNNVHMMSSKTGQGSHWSLLVYDSASATFYHFDSYGGCNYRNATRLARKLEATLPTTVPSSSKDQTSDSKCKPKGSHTHRSKRQPVVEAKSPQQTNGYHCADYLLSTARALAQTATEGIAVKDSGKQLHEHVPKAASQLRGDLLKWIKAIEEEMSKKS